MPDVTATPGLEVSCPCCHSSSTMYFVKPEERNQCKDCWCIWHEPSRRAPSAQDIPEWLVELCMLTEAVTPTTDLRATVEALISYHVHVERDFPSEQENLKLLNAGEGRMKLKDYVASLPANEREAIKTEAARELQKMIAETDLLRVMAEAMLAEAPLNTFTMRGCDTLAQAALSALRAHGIMLCKWHTESVDGTVREIPLDAYEFCSAFLSGLSPPETGEAKP